MRQRREKIAARQERSRHADYIGRSYRSGRCNRGQNRSQEMKLAALGNSITANAVGASGWANDGYLTWVRQLTGQRFNCHRDNVFATGGFTIAQIISTWLGPCVAAKPDICIVEAGHNSIDGVAGNTPTYQRELKLIFDALRNAGIYVVVMPIMVDSGGNAWNTQQTYQVAYLNN
jgi:hypothetical protein